MLGAANAGARDLLLGRIVDWNEHYNRLIAMEQTAIVWSKWMVAVVFVLAICAGLPALLALDLLPEAARSLLWQTAGGAGGLFELKLFHDILERRRNIVQHESRKALLEGKRRTSPDEFAKVEELAVRELFGG